MVLTVLRDRFLALRRLLLYNLSLLLDWGLFGKFKIVFLWRSILLVNQLRFVVLTSQIQIRSFPIWNEFAFASGCVWHSPFPILVGRNIGQTQNLVLFSMRNDFLVGQGLVSFEFSATTIQIPRKLIIVIHWVLVVLPVRILLWMCVRNPVSILWQLVLSYFNLIKMGFVLLVTRVISPLFFQIGRNIWPVLSIVKTSLLFWNLQICGHKMQTLSQSVRNGWLFLTFTHCRNLMIFGRSSSSRRVNSSFDPNLRQYFTTIRNNSASFSRKMPHFLFGFAFSTSSFEENFLCCISRELLGFLTHFWIKSAWQELSSIIWLVLMPRLFHHSVSRDFITCHVAILLGSPFVRQIGGIVSNQRPRAWSSIHSPACLISRSFSPCRFRLTLGWPLV